MIKYFLALIFLAFPVFSQTNANIAFVTAAPSGSCAVRAQMRLYIPSGVLYSCQNGTWAAMSGGSGITSIAAACGITATPDPIVATGTVLSKSTCITVANESMTGTVDSSLATYTGDPSTAIITASGDIAMGVVVSGGGTTGNVLIQTQGIATCQFDGAGVTAGHYVGVSATAGRCTDAGATYPTSGQVLGVALATWAGNSFAPVDMSLRQSVVASGGGSSITQGAYASLPATCTTGDMYLPTDSLINPAHCSATNTWSSFVGSMGGLVTPPILTDFTVINAGTSTTDITHGGIRLNTITGDNAFNFHGLVKSAPATPYHVITCLVPAVSGVSNSQIGLAFREASTGKIVQWGTFQNSSTQYVAFYLSDNTSFGGTAINTSSSAWSGQICLRIGDDGVTNRTYDISVDGRITWVQVGTESRTSNFVADQVGLFVDGPLQTGYFLDYEETN